MTDVDPIDAARAILPAWVPWAGLAWVPIAYLAGAALASLAAWPARRLTGDAGAPDLHWTERARRASAQRGAIYLTAFLVGGLGWFAALASEPSVGRAPPGLLRGAIGVAALAGALAPRRRLQRGLGLPSSPLLLARDVLAFAVLFPSVFLGATTAYLLPLGRGVGPCLAVFAGGVGCAVVAQFAGKLVAGRALGVVRPGSARVTAIVEEAARRARTRPRPVIEVRWSVANAFAFPFAQKVGFTDAAVRALDDEQLRAVAAHELAHLDEPRSVRVVRALGGLALTAGLPLTTAATASQGAIGAGMVLFPFVALWALLQRMARRVEERADAAAARAEGAIYARALERLYEVNLMPAVPRGRGVHPPLYDRLVSAGAAPSYPRPAPPRFAFLASLGVALVSAPAFGVVLLFTLGFAGSMARVAMHGGWESLAELADERLAAGDHEGAVTLAGAAYTLAERAEADDCSRGRAGLALARALAEQGQCAEALERLTAAAPAVAGETLRERKEALARARAAVSGCLGSRDPPRPR